MRRFSVEDILAIMSDDHRMNTAWALQKQSYEVTAVELVAHWLEFHIVPVLHFIVDEPEEQGWLFV